MVRSWAKGNTILSPPPELLLYINCERFNVLPDSGGWYDQTPEVCFAFSLIGSIIEEEKVRREKDFNKKK